MVSDTFLDLNDEKDHKQLKSLILNADIFSQGYRKGALAKRGLGPEQLAEQEAWHHMRVHQCLRACWPMGSRPGWEQLAQTASGVAVDEGSLDSPRLIAAAATDYTTDYLGALGAMAALHRRSTRAAVIMSRYRSLRLPIGCTSLSCLREITRYRLSTQRSRRLTWCRLKLALVTFTIWGRSYRCLRLNQGGSKSAFRWDIIPRPGNWSWC